LSRSSRTGPGSNDPGAGLRTLLVLVTDALAAVPALANLGSPLVTAGGPAITRMAIDASTNTASTSTALPDPAAAPGSDPDDSGIDDSSIDDSDFDECHVETWRLVTRAQGGDGEAFGLLYDRYVDTVYRFIYFRVNDRALAEDFTSETFLRALRRISTISYQGRDIGAWFVTIARNIVLDHIKSARNRLEITTADTIEGNDRADSTETTVLAALTSERLMQAVQQLGEEQRECVLLRFIQGFSVSETAEVMGKNDGAIKALQHRAVRKLAELVGGDLR
jgi:RNA polymerase sigma-70 factor (ECF subfamily)